MIRIVRAIGRALMRPPARAGLVVGLVFWWFSLVPSLMPRSWLVQAAISAICLGIGYAIGVLGAWVVRRSRPPANLPQLPAWAPTAAAGVTVVIVVVGCWAWVRWQNQQRELLAMDDIAAVVTIAMIPVTVLLTVVLAMIGRLVAGVVRRIDRWNRAHLPASFALPATIVLVVAGAWFLLRDVAGDAFITWADRSFSLVDQGTSEGTVRPDDDTVSGSPASLIEWDDLGMQGRDFVAHATGEADMRTFAEQVGHDPDAVMAPVRVYAGMESADDVEERAELAVADLVRAGGFDRDVLIVATSTGTGWIDPDASRTIELMHGGDTAIVSMQYSFLPSWISFITDLERAETAGAELLHAVRDEWLQRPPEDRPRLIAFGLSLGAYGASGAFTGQEADTSISNIVTRTDGALLLGTPYATPLLRQLVDDRDSGSPAWAPIVEEGRSVRFDTRDPDQPQATGQWDEPRVLMFQHPSDPVVHWYYNWLWSPPEWMDAPRGNDVPAKASWFPIVTGVQGVFDLMAGFSAPPGHGHDYRLDYPAAWAAVAAPAEWSDDHTIALEDFAQAERDEAERDAAATAD